MENSQENTTFILADVKVFDFLKEKAGDRKTKTEAYWDLLDRSMAGFVSPFVRKVERKLLPNQCHVTISDLAEFWPSFLLFKKQQIFHLPSPLDARNYLAFIAAEGNVLLVNIPVSGFQFLYQLAFGKVFAT